MSPCHYRKLIVWCHIIAVRRLPCLIQMTGQKLSSDWIRSHAFVKRATFQVKRRWLWFYLENGELCLVYVHKIPYTWINIFPCFILPIWRDLVKIRATVSLQRHRIMWLMTIVMILSILNSNYINVHTNFVNNIWIFSNTKDYFQVELI